MQRDLRGTALYREAETLYRTLRQPGTGQISDASEIHASSDGSRAVFAGAFMDKLEGSPFTRICQVDFVSGETRVLTSGPNTDRLPKYSPDGSQIAFLSDRHRAGDAQLYLIDPSSGAVRPTPRVDGWVEYLHWSPDGRRILLGVAGHGAEVAGGQGAIASRRHTGDLPAWMPAVDSGNEAYRWRRVWVYELATNRVHQVGAREHNIWEAVWCGRRSFVAVVSPGPGEGLWYSARLRIFDTETGDSRELYEPAQQIGLPAASTSGAKAAVVEAFCSDRWQVAGDLRLIDIASALCEHIDTQGIDVSHTEWVSERYLLVAGHRGFDTAVGLYDADSQTFNVVWSSSSITTVGKYATVSGFGTRGDCVLLGEGFSRSAEVAVIRAGEYRAVKTYSQAFAQEITGVLDTVERVTWTAADGLAIQGWLLLPKRTTPVPLIMAVHGGPNYHWRPQFLARRGIHALMLLRRGYALFYPNPRGSSGRGQDFARAVAGDMGGADAQDLLSGLDTLVARGIADPKRLGVTGGSYGGFMSAWLVTQDARFAAAIASSPHTNQVTERLLSNIPQAFDLLLEDEYHNPRGRYVERSPIMHADNARTPTLCVCGALDRCTPPEEAIQFHNALLENGVHSVLISYPQEGHGVRKLPAAIDYSARVVCWFEEHIG
jgi:dipeptidyl aminopeptidase/acylaminoacyl peptidase